MLDILLAQCGIFFTGYFPIAVSVFLAGLLGSITHCSVMCSPTVAAQMLDIEERKQAQWRMGYYHAGRLATYALLGAVAFTASQVIFGNGLSVFAPYMISLAGLLFFASALLPKQTHRCCSKRKTNLIDTLSRWFKGKAHYFLRGMLMGFMPCGMIVSVLLLVATSDHMLVAASLMLLFGLATIPALQISGFGMLAISRRYPTHSSTIRKTMMAANGFLLCGIGFGLIGTI